MLLVITPMKYLCVLFVLLLINNSHNSYIIILSPISYNSILYKLIKNLYQSYITFCCFI